MSLEQQIEATMVRAADDIGAANFTADEILHKGRSARAHRRARRTVAGVAAVVLAVIATLTVTNLPMRTRVEPAGRPTPQSWPFPTSAAQDGPSPASLGITFANGTQIVPAVGPRLTMSLPPQTYILSGERVAGGWVVNTRSATSYQDDGWFQPADGSAPTRLASTVWAVAHDRNYLIVAGRIEPSLTVYRLPTMSKGSDTSIPVDNISPIAAVQVVGDDAYASYTLRGGPVNVARWSLKTFMATNSSPTVFSMGIFGDSVLRHADQGNTSCVDLVPIYQFPEGGTSGVCSTYLDRAGGVLSPDGRRAVITGDVTEPLLLVDTADLHAGVWRPTTITGQTQFIAWVTATSFLAAGDRRATPVVLCTGPDSCAPIGLPAGDPAVVFLRDAVG
jgi:hypothetical protein